MVKVKRNHCRNFASSKTHSEFFKKFETVLLLFLKTAIKFIPFIVLWCYIRIRCYIHVLDSEGQQPGDGGGGGRRLKHYCNCQFRPLHLQHHVKHCTVDRWTVTITTWGGPTWSRRRLSTNHYFSRESQSGQVEKKIGYLYSYTLNPIPTTMYTELDNVAP